MENRLFDTGFLPSWPRRAPGPTADPQGSKCNSTSEIFIGKTFSSDSSSVLSFRLFCLSGPPFESEQPQEMEVAAAARRWRSILQSLVTVNTKYFWGLSCVLMLFSFREAFNSLFLEPSLGWSEAAELFMDATSNRAGRKSLLCSLLAWVTFERLLVRLGRRLQWAGNHYTKPSVLHGAPQPPLLLATSSTSHPLTSGEGMMSGFFCFVFLRRAVQFFTLEKEEETMPFNLGCLSFNPYSWTMQKKKQSSKMC